MTASRGRRLHLSDGMILVAATAIGMAATAVGHSPTAALWIATIGESLGKVRSFSAVDYYILFDDLILLASPALIAWAAALLALRLRSPRPDRRHLVRQPGMVATLTTVIMASGAFAIFGIRSLIAGLGFYPVFQVLHYFIGPAVGGAWLALWMGRRWRPERGPIDLLGRVVGLLWISIDLIRWSHRLFIP